MIGNSRDGYERPSIWQESTSSWHINLDIVSVPWFSSTGSEETVDCWLLTYRNSSARIGFSAMIWTVIHTFGTCATYLLFLFTLLRCVRLCRLSSKDLRCCECGEVAIPTHFSLLCLILSTTNLLWFWYDGFNETPETNHRGLRITIDWLPRVSSKYHQRRNSNWIPPPKPEVLSFDRLLCM